MYAYKYSIFTYYMRVLLVFHACQIYTPAWFTGLNMVGYLFFSCDRIPVFFMMVMDCFMSFIVIRVVMMIMYCYML